MILAKRFGLIVLLLSTVGCTPSAPAAEGKGVVLIELFTSEGCSSCPPADKLLEELAADAKKNGSAVHCLSFHVDYWNRLGWKDPFSDPAFTQRQEAYAKSLRLRGLYTPQMIVNGSDEFVGSDRSLAAKSIKAALSGKTSITLDLKASADGKNIAVAYKLKEAPEGAVLCVAWVEAEATSHPDRGENQGEKLHHINIVRDLQTIELKAPFEGKVSLKRMDVKTGRVIAFVQEAKTGRVLGVASAEVAADR